MEMNGADALIDHCVRDMGLRELKSRQLLDGVSCAIADPFTPSVGVRPAPKCPQTANSRTKEVGISKVQTSISKSLARF